jgi:hypothetical protein
MRQWVIESPDEQPERARRCALLATIVSCAVVDIGLRVFAAWPGDSVAAGIFVFFLAGGPLTFLIAPTVYRWFHSTHA